MERERGWGGKTWKVPWFDFVDVNFGDGVEAE